MREGEPNPNNEQSHREKVEINEPLEVKELFELLVNAGLKGFKPEFTQELEKSGAKKRNGESEGGQSRQGGTPPAPFFTRP